MQTPSGVKKLRQTMIKKYGSEAAWKEQMRLIGKRGGSVKTFKGFAMDIERASEAGKKGGVKSRPYSVNPRTTK